MPTLPVPPPPSFPPPSRGPIARKIFARRDWGSACAFCASCASCASRVSPRPLCSSPLWWWWCVAVSPTQLVVTPPRQAIRIGRMVQATRDMANLHIC
ncbi:hypothetical protein BS50DRAFT_50185 [Corynespora cassiicola Philippines]|uniref:Uncharacterized protein n=1 Tax=Corynespora cassiicola Philippines TaxID=1448308 RepID=A0A2T2NI41_CORCC|nr:hypothetical protein BS50DRAFT_50185 [Corynespora cassiicola Philippines]